jgi:hypothetical protein
MAVSEDDKNRAREAKRILSEPLLVEALTNVRVNALNGLGTVEPTNTDEIRRLQAVVTCTYELLVERQTMIAKGGLLDGEVSGEQTGE